MADVNNGVEDVRRLLLHASHLSRHLDRLLVSTPQLPAHPLAQLHPLLHQIVRRFHHAIQLLLHPHPQPSFLPNPSVHPPNMVPIVEHMDAGFTQLLMTGEHVPTTAVPMNAPVTVSNLQAGRENGMTNHVDIPVICKKRKVDCKSNRPTCCRIQNIGSSSGSSTSDSLPLLETEGGSGESDLLSPCSPSETDGKDASGDDEHNTVSNRAPKNLKKRTWLPRTTVRLQGQMHQLNDTYTWRKYGQKRIQGTNYARSYYRCRHRDDFCNCPAKKQVQQCHDRASAFDVTYIGNHTCGAVQLDNQMAVSSNAAPRSVHLPDLFPTLVLTSSNNLLISETNSAAPLSPRPSSSNADLHHQLALEPATMHSVSPAGVRTQDTKGLASTSAGEAFSIAPSSLSAQPNLSDFSFSGSNEWPLEENEILTSLLSEIQELPSKRDATLDQYNSAKPGCCWLQQYHQDLHIALSSMESKEPQLAGFKSAYLRQENQPPAAIMKQGSISPATTEFSTHLGETVNENLRDHSSKQPESEAMSSVSNSLTPQFDFLDYLFDMEA